MPRAITTAAAAPAERRIRGQDGCPDSGGCYEYSPGLYSIGICVGKQLFRLENVYDCDLSGRHLCREWVFRRLELLSCVQALWMLNELEARCFILQAEELLTSTRTLASPQRCKLCDFQYVYWNGYVSERNQVHRSFDRPQ